jgi:hypothetical protein
VFVSGKHVAAHIGKDAIVSDAMTASIFARRMVILPDFARRYKLDREKPE